MNNSNKVGYTVFRLESFKFSTCLLGSSLYCGWCGRSFHCPNELENHFLTKHLKTCPCGQKFADNQSLLDHVNESGCYLPPPSSTHFFDDESTAAANAECRRDDSLAGKHLACSSDGAALLRIQSECLQSANADEHQTACINERTPLDRVRFVESSQTDRRKHASVSPVAKPEVRRPSGKDEESPDEVRFLRSCFVSMLGGLMRCRLCSHVYAQWHTAYVHVRSAHNEELTKWRDGRCKPTDSDKPEVSKERRRSQDAQPTSFQMRKHDGGTVMSTKRAKCKQRNDMPEAAESQSNNLPSNRTEPEAVSGDRETSGSCRKKQHRNPSDARDELDTVGRTSFSKFCRVCDTSYCNLAAYLRHLSLPGRCCAAFGYLTSKCQKLSDGRAECRVCGEKFATRSRVYKHIRLIHGIPDVIPSISLKPEGSGKAAADGDGIGAVSATADGHATAQQSRCPQLTCLTCRRTFKSRSSLQRHRIVCRYKSTRKGNKSTDSAAPAELTQNGSSAGHKFSSGIGNGRRTWKFARTTATTAAAESARGRSIGSIFIARCVQRGARGKFMCTVCNAVYRHRPHVYRHARNAHSKLCEKLERQRAQVSAEASNSMASATKITDGAKPRRFRSLRALGFTCIKCGLMFKSRSIYLQHHARCTGKRIRRNSSAMELVYLSGKCQRLPDGRTACDLCGKSATRQHDVYRHIRDKHGIPEDIAGTDSVKQPKSKRVESSTADKAANTATQ